MAFCERPDIGRFNLYLKVFWSEMGLKYQVSYWWWIIKKALRIEYMTNIWIVIMDQMVVTKKWLEIHPFLMDIYWRGCACWIASKIQIPTWFIGQWRHFYGVKQYPKTWDDKINYFFSKNGFSHSFTNVSLYIFYEKELL